MRGLTTVSFADYSALLWNADEDNAAIMAAKLRKHFAAHPDGDVFEAGKELLPVHSPSGFNIIDKSVRGKGPLYVRKAHFGLWEHVESAYDAVQRRFLSAKRRVTMVGNPGIGKVSAVDWRDCIRSSCPALTGRRGCCRAGRSSTCWVACLPKACPPLCSTRRALAESMCFAPAAPRSRYRPSTRELLLCAALSPRRDRA